MDVFTLSTSSGIEVVILDFGASLQSISVPDRTGRCEPIVLGYADVQDYRPGTSYFGALVGRYANRIARGRFILDGVTHQLTVNDPPNHLHGGVVGFNKRLWIARASDAHSVRLEYTSADGEEQYPGTVRAAVTYALRDDELTATYEATTDRATPINLTQHTYWNLTGGRRDILGHELQIAADHYTPVDATKIPTGEIAEVAGTPFDFRTARPIARGDYDHNWVLDASAADADLTRDREPRFAARVYDPESGRGITIHTTEPGVQFYAGSLLERKHWGLCLETQHFPDSPNHPAFPSTILRPGERYSSRTSWRFEITK